jgi:type I restriction enzyme S subunit
MKAGWASEPLTNVCVIKPPKSEAKKSLASNDSVSFVPMEDLGIDQKKLSPKKVRSLGEVAGS